MADLSGSAAGGLTTAWLRGGYQTKDRTALVLLRGQVIVAGAGPLRSMLTEDEGSTAYQVPAGKTLILTRAIVHATVAAARWYIESATTAIGLNAVAGGTGVAGLDNPRADEGNPIVVTTANTIVDVDIDVEIAAGRFPNMRALLANCTVTVLLFGVEV